MAVIKFSKQEIKQRLLHPLGEKYEKIIRKYYLTSFNVKSAGGVDMEGTKWKPLKPITVKLKRKKNSPYVNYILRDTGKLYKSIHTKYFKTDTTIRTWVDLNEVPYAIYHQEGTPNMPERKILEDLPQDLIDELKDDATKTINVFFQSMLETLQSQNIKVTSFA